MSHFNVFCSSDELPQMVEYILSRRNGHNDAVPLPTPFLEGTENDDVPTREGQSSLETFRSNYAKLPDHLKSCLHYCCLVSKKYRIEKDKLVRLLLAEGLIQVKPGEIMEDVAEKVVEEFIGLGMLEEDVFIRERLRVPSPYRQIFGEKMDRENKVAEATNSPIRLFLRDDGKDNIPPSTWETLPITSLFVKPAKRRGLYDEGHLSRAYLKAICKLKFLMVLDLDGKIECLPGEVGDLVHLTYLGLFCSYLKELPGTIGNLQKLQTLDIRFSDLKQGKLSIEVLNIKQLRHLLMSTSMNNCEIRVPKEIGTMLNLQTLDGVYAGDGIASELGKLTQLRNLGILRFSDDHANELSEAIMKMENLVCLSLKGENSWEESDLFPELELFSLPKLLQELTLSGHLVEMPHWLSSMENLTTLCLAYSYLSEYETSIIQLLPKLKHLTLWKASKSKVIDKEFCREGGFPKLETLEIASTFLLNWTEIVNGAFPKLRSLTFGNCLRLMFLPDGLQYISTLEELRMEPAYNQDLVRRLKGDENYKIKNIPYVWCRTTAFM